MRILFETPAMTQYTDEAIFTYELARALPFKHDVAIASHWGNNALLKGLNHAGIRCITNEQADNETFDICIGVGCVPKSKTGFPIEIEYKDFPDDRYNIVEIAKNFINNL